MDRTQEHLAAPHGQSGPVPWPLLSGDHIDALADKYKAPAGFDVYGLIRDAEAAIHNIIKESQCK